MEGLSNAVRWWIYFALGIESVIVGLAKGFHFLP